jgi:hypothetical protein
VRRGSPPIYPATLRFEQDTSLGFVLLLVLDDDGRELAAVGAWGEG